MMNSVCSQNLQSTYLYYDSIHFLFEKKKTGPEMEQNQSVSTMNFPKYFLIKIFLTS